MTLTEIYKKRKQTKLFDTKIIPEKKLINNLLEKTFELTASKQNLMPYKIHVLGPEHQSVKEEFNNIVLTLKGGQNNDNIITGPYILFFTHRLVKPNSIIQSRIDKGHVYHVCDIGKYKWQKREVAIEIGMFSKILTGLCMENNIDVAYNLCFPSFEDSKELYKNFSFLDNEAIVFTMQLGYKDNTVSKTYKKDWSQKPSLNEVIKWF